jgi:U3 small nucleolar ribonucleoprotein protein IMP4
VYTKKGKEVELAEVGPRFEMKRKPTWDCISVRMLSCSVLVYQIKLGTADQTDADKEWVAKPYLHTAKKKKYL